MCVFGVGGVIKCIFTGVHHQPSQPRIFLPLSISLSLSLSLPSLSLIHSFLGLLTSASLVCVPANWILCVASVTR